MKLKLTCPTCRKKFKTDPQGETFVVCPNCESRLAVPLEALELIAAQNELRPAKRREGGWIVAAVGAFILVWALIVFVLWVRHRSSGAPVVTAPQPVVPSVPAPPPVSQQVETPAPRPRPLPATQPSTQPVVTEKPAIPIRPGTLPSKITDEQIEAAIRKGIGYLLARVAPDGGLTGDLGHPDTYNHGMHALATYALLHCSQHVNDPRIAITSDTIKAMIERMKSHPMEAGASSNEPVTYARSLRTSALAVYGRREDREALARDVRWLIAASYEGAFGYDDVYIRPASSDPVAQRNPPAPPALKPGVHPPTDFSPDNSNSQYGMFGVWTAAESGIDIPASFWQAVERHWTKCQTPEGMWSYRPENPYPTYNMTLAGLTALSVVRDYLPASTTTSEAESREPARIALQKAIQWFQTGDNAMEIVNSGDSSDHWGYGLYGLERAALATGMLYAGKHDIYRQIASQLLREQHADGSWRASVPKPGIINTSFALLFLSRGQHPVMINKLAYNGRWDARPRDLSLLTRFSSHAMEKPVNWQVVNLRQDWQQWLDSPILYVSGSQPIEFTETDLAKIREYVHNGGLLFTHSENNSKAFEAFVVKLAGQLFPGKAFEDVPADDDLYKMVFPIDAKTRPMKMVSNGARRWMIHSSSDLSMGWISRQQAQRTTASRMAINLFIFATGRGTLQPRTTTTYVPPNSDTVFTLPVARVRFDGEWNPEPAAWTRLGNRLAWELGWNLELSPRQCEDLNPRVTPLAILTSVDAPNLTSEQMLGLRKFVEGGGVLLIDPVGGRKSATGAMSQLLSQILPGETIKPMPADHPVLTGEFERLAEKLPALPRATLRPYSTQVARPESTAILYTTAGTGAVILSPVDVTTGLLGTATWNVNGYQPDYCEKLARNIVAWAATK